jgi:uncharacterized protein YndB with AHSA1/START domain
MSIAPVKCAVEVKSSLPRAFELFAQNMGAWWPRGQTPAGKPHADLIIEPRKDGRWFERDADGKETEWGKVLSWEPPHRLILGWQLNPKFQFDANVLMEVEIRFDGIAGGGTRISLEHRDIEQLGSEAKVFAGKIGSGWPERMRDFVDYVANRP